MLRLFKTPTNIDKKISNYNHNKLNNDKLVIKKNPYINFNFNLIQNKNMSQNKIRTITPNLKLREIVNKKINENNYEIGNFFKIRNELPEITRNNHNYFHNRSYMNTEYTKKKDSNEKIDKQLKLIFVMKNKISELNKIIKDKNKEILILKNYAHLNNNNNNNILNKIKAEKEKNLNEEKNIKNTNNIKSLNNDNKKEIKNFYREKENNSKTKIIKKKKNMNKNRLTLVDNLQRNEEVEKLNKEIQNLNKIINDLDGKYKNEIKKNYEFNQKFTFMKNCTFGLNAPRVQIEEKIKNYENKIIDLEEQLFQYKQRESKEKIILSNQEYSNIQICLNALIVLNKIKDTNILNNNEKITFENIEKISRNICDLLKISNNVIISNFINDYIIKNTKNVLYTLTFDALMIYKTPNDNFNNSILFSFIKERCTIYDYRKEGKIPIMYLRHIYNEFCYKNNIDNNGKEFFDLVYICKKNLKNSYYSNVYDISYENLVINEKENENLVIKKFIDTIMNEEIEKVREREKYYKLIKVKKDNNKLNNNRMNGNYNYNKDDFII